MNRDNPHDNLEDIARNLDQRKPVFVDEKGQIHDAEKLGRRDDDEQKPVTQLKPTTWFS
ncbi:MAG: hypothetical protein WCI73_08070 [Phycisphaerae bacterium]